MPSYPKCFCGLLVLPLVMAWSCGSVAQGQVVVNRASTVGESHARGLADMVRSQGEYNLLTSQALINSEQARRQQLENDLRQTEVFFERRAINRQQRFGDYPERAARNAARAVRDSERMMIRYGQAGHPARLTSRELDRLTGRITWPLFLQGPQYAEPRQTVDNIMRHRALQDEALNLEQFQAIMGATDQMQATLQGRIREMNSMDFMNTRRFIDRLVYEVRNPDA